MGKFKNINEQADRIKELFGDDRLFGNLIKESREEDRQIISEQDMDPVDLETGESEVEDSGVEDTPKRASNKELRQQKRAANKADRQEKRADMKTARQTKRAEKKAAKDKFQDTKSDIKQDLKQDLAQNKQDFKDAKAGVEKAPQPKADPAQPSANAKAGGGEGKEGVKSGSLAKDALAGKQLKPVDGSRLQSGFSYAMNSNTKDIYKINQSNGKVDTVYHFNENFDRSLLFKSVLSEDWDRFVNEGYYTVDTNEGPKKMSDKFNQIANAAMGGEDTTIDAIAAKVNADSPFANAEEGNKFRQWVNDNQPEKAKELKLDPQGSHNNSYIKKAWAELGDMYTDAMKTPEKMAMKKTEPLPTNEPELKMPEKRDEPVTPSDEETADAGKEEKELGNQISGSGVPGTTPFM
jgi:hypothetical protein